MWSSLDALQMYLVTLPTCDVLRTSIGALRHKLIVELTAGEVHGYGEVPLVSEDLFDERVRASYALELAEALRAALSAAVSPEPAVFDRALCAQPLDPISSFALSSAYWDLFLKIRETRGSSVLRSQQAPRSTRFCSLDELRGGIAYPYPRGKGRTLADLESVLSADSSDRASLLIVDFNQSLASDSLARLIALIGDKQVLCEEPFAGFLLQDYRSLYSEKALLFSLDESLADLAASRAAIDVRAAPCLTLKPWRAGSVTTFLDLAATARQHTQPFRLGGMFESAVGRALSVLLAAHLSPEYPSDISPSQSYFTDDILSERLELSESGTIKPFDTLGIVPPIDRRRLQCYCNGYHRAAIR